MPDVAIPSSYAVIARAFKPVAISKGFLLLFVTFPL